MHCWGTLSKTSYKVKREVYKIDYIVAVISTKRKINVCVCIRLYIYAHICIFFQTYKLFPEANTRNRGAAEVIVFGNSNLLEAEILEYFYSIPSISVYTSFKML